MIALADSVEIAYEDVGIGPPIVLLHGFPHNRSLWSPQVGGLVDRARCIVPDLRGFGETTVAPPYTMDQYADDVAALLDSLRVERAVLVGLSMGGYVAFAFWRRHRQKVRALVLASTRAGADSPAAQQKRRDLIAIAQERGSGAVADSVLKGMLGASTYEKSPETVELVHRMLSLAPVGGVIGALQALISRPDSTPTLPTIDVPTLVIVGQEDSLTPVDEAKIMHSGVRGSRLEVLACAGHLCNVERPAAFNHVLSEFLASITLA